MQDCTDADKQEIGARFRAALGQYIFTPEEFSKDKTLAQLAATGKRLIVSDKRNSRTILFMQLCQNIDLLK